MIHLKEVEMLGRKEVQKIECPVGSTATFHAGNPPVGRCETRTTIPSTSPKQHASSSSSRRGSRSAVVRSRLVEEFESGRMQVAGVSISNPEVEQKEVFESKVY